MKLKTVLVTGGSGEIGKSISKSFLEKGFFVYIQGSKKESLKSISSELKFHKGNYKTIQFNANEICKKNSSDKISYESIDILVNAIGGGGIHESWENTSIEKWQHVYNLNVLAPVYFIKKVIPHLKNKRYGRIINIASISATKTLNIGPEYNAAKAAVVNFTKSLAQEFKGTHTTVNSISPGLVLTDLVKRVMCEKYKITNKNDEIKINGVISKEFYPNLVLSLPKANEIAGFIEYLCSDNARHITGQNIIIDSGYSLSDFVKKSIE